MANYCNTDDISPNGIKDSVVADAKPKESLPFAVKRFRRELIKMGSEPVKPREYLAGCWPVKLQQFCRCAIRIFDTPSAHARANRRLTSS